MPHIAHARQGAPRRDSPGQPARRHNDDVTDNTTHPASTPCLLICSKDGMYVLRSAWGWSCMQAARAWSLNIDRSVSDAGYIVLRLSSALYTCGAEESTSARGHSRHGLHAGPSGGIGGAKHKLATCTRMPPELGLACTATSPVSNGHVICFRSLARVIEMTHPHTHIHINAHAHTHRVRE
jgi:hypothetical protein